MIFGEDHDLARLKWAFESCKNGAWGDEPDGETDAVCIRAADFNADLGTLNDGERTLRSIDETTYRKVGLRSGDLVVEKSGGGEKQLVGRSVVYRGSGRAVCSNFLARCRPSDLVTSEYLNYLMLGIYKSRGTYPHIKQTTGIQNLDMASFLNTRVKLPPLEAQMRIAAFLDEKTARIDALIAKKQALLGRLAEKRQAIITQAVTKGLNHAAPMKDSGIDWLGQIPAHWEVIPLKWQCSIRSGQVDPTEPPYDEMTLVAPDHIESGTGRLLARQTATEQAAISGKYLCRPEDVLYSKIRPALRKVALTDEVCLCSADMYAIAPGKDYERDYLFYFLLTDAFTSYAELASMRVAMPKVNREALGSFPLLKPPVAEQQSIICFIAAALAQLDVAWASASASITKLTEYRSALITAAVTGQMEV